MIKRLALVGLGSIGRRHLRIIKEIRPEIEVVLVRSGQGDSWPEEKLATRTVYSICAAIEAGVEAVIISSPTTEHLAQAIEFAKSGVHILIEKPLSNTSDGIDDLLTVTKEKKLVVMVGYVLRYDPSAIKFKQWLSEECVGKLLHIRIECGSYLPDWRPEQDYRKTVSASLNLGGGVLLELSHELDYLHWFFGKPSEVQAILRNSETLDLDVEDQADLLMLTNNGCTISMQLDFCRRHPTRKCNVQTTKGELTWDAMKKQVVWQLYGDEPVVDKLSFDRDYMYRKQLEHYLDCIEKDKEPIVSLENGIEVMQLIDAVHLANQSAEKISI